MDHALWPGDDRLSVLDMESSSLGGGGGRDKLMLWEMEGERLGLLCSRRHTSSASLSLIRELKLLNYEDL